MIAAIVDEQTNNTPSPSLGKEIIGILFQSRIGMPIVLCWQAKHEMKKIIKKRILDVPASQTYE